MSSFYQNIESWRPTTSSTVDFILSGRRTLTENLPSETFKLPVSIALRSRRLHHILTQQTWSQPGERPIKLENVDPAGFKLYIEWLRTGHIVFGAVHVPIFLDGALLCDCVDLFFAHILGSQFNEPNFQDYVIDTMGQLLDASQIPDVQFLGSVLLEQGVADVLRQFVIDRMFAVEKKMLRMIKGSVHESGSGGQSELACQYHVHGEGKCYKDSLLGD
ncbi:hypothetical protein GQ44DRAFT_685064, partial [Phaeosphaeriaceae sp. PMI808]